MGEHNRQRSFKESIKPPKRFSVVQKCLWYIGLFLMALTLCAALGAVVGTILGLIRWLVLFMIGG